MRKLNLLIVIVLTLSVITIQAVDAKINYEKFCVKCHGVNGGGDTKMGKKLGVKNYSNSKIQAEMKDDNAFKVIKEGLKDKEGKILMKSSEGLSNEDIKSLVIYMRKFNK